MTDHRPELADVFRAHHSDFLKRWSKTLSCHQRKALRDIQNCRTAALGGHLHQCDRCGHRVLLYNSCRNRHCPKCQATARARWLTQRQTELLPVPYFHVVFTLPQQIALLALQNARPIYNPCSKPLPELCWKRQQIHGFWALPSASWLCFTPGDRICSYTRTCFASCRAAASRATARAGSPAASPPFFLPVRVLSHRFRKLSLRSLQSAFRKGSLRFHGELCSLADPSAFQRLCDQASAVQWVVHVKPPLADPNGFSSIWLATRTAWRFPPIVYALWRMAASRLSGRIMLTAVAPRP